MNRKVLNISLKMIIAGIISLIIGKLLNLTFYTTASAAAILSIQITKRDFIVIGVKRLISTLISITFAALFFYYFGQTFLTFSIYLILLIFLSWALNAPEGIVLSVVLVAHFLVIDEITLSFYFEEILLIIVSLSVSFLVNMFYPELSVSKIKISLSRIDLLIESYIYKIVDNINNKENNQFINYENEINSILNNAKLIDKNILVQNDHRYITYLYMRQMQFNILTNIDKNFKKIKVSHQYIKVISELLLDISKNISFSNKAEACLITKNETLNYFINEPLPKSRDEFETRAILFHIISEIESFLNLKIEFHEKYPSFNEGEI